MEQTRATGCHIVCVGYDGETDDVRVVCPTLPESIVDEIECSATPWFAGRWFPKTIWGVVRRHELPGIALVWNQSPFPKPKRGLDSDYYLKKPPPFDLPFEPIELSENDARLSVFEETSPTGRGAGFLPKLPPSSSYGWLFIVLGLVGLVAFILSVAAGTAPCYVFILFWLFLLLVMRLPFFRNAGWFLVPGGVVVRKTPFGRSRARLTVHTPSNTVLVLLPRPPGWRATLTGPKTHKRFLTQRECKALLRVWQSGLEVPTCLDDLR